MQLEDLNDWMIQGAKVVQKARAKAQRNEKAKASREHHKLASGRALETMAAPGFLHVRSSKDPTAAFHIQRNNSTCTLGMPMARVPSLAPRC